jgi:YD repeat-containing protein
MRNLVLALIAFMLCWAQAASATTYSYNPAGRLIAAIAADGSSAVYTYDSAGNITGIQRLLASNLAIFAFSPGQGISGQQVTIVGSGFSTTPGSNTAKFNGTSATVLSSTVNQLVVTIPSSATTGLISVKVGSNTVNSAQSFVIANSLAPTIISFTPALVDIGSSVTMTGANFNPVPGETNIRIAEAVVSLNSISSTQAVFAPQVDGSGPIQIATPYGSATSVTELTVAPSTILAANIVASGALIENGASHALNINQQSKYGVLTFDASAGEWLSIQLSALSTSPSGGLVSYELFSPGNQSITRGWVSASATSIHLPQLVTTGTYLIAFNGANQTEQLTASLEKNATLILNGSPVTISTAIATQSKRMIFSATSGQTDVLYVSSIVTVPANINIAIPVSDSLGNVVTTGSAQTTSTINLPSLAAGFYSVLFQGTDGYHFGTASGQISIATGVAATLPTSGTGGNYATADPGQLAYFSFAGTAGQNLGLAVTNLLITPDTFGNLSVPVINPDGSLLLSANCLTTDPGCQLSLLNLPQTGTYTIALDPVGSSTMSFTLTLSQDTTGNLTLNSPLAVNLPAIGENALLKFVATSGQSATLTLDTIVTSPASTGVLVSVYDPSWNPVSSVDSAGQSSVVLSLSSLVAGTYNIVIAPDFGVTATVRATIQ